MARLPIPGQDLGAWGNILNDFLSQAHSSDGALRASVVGADQIQDGSVTSAKVEPAIVASLQKADGAIQRNGETAAIDLRGASMTLPAATNGMGVYLLTNVLR